MPLPFAAKGVLGHRDGQLGTALTFLAFLRQHLLASQLLMSLHEMADTELSHTLRALEKSSGSASTAAADPSLVQPDHNGAEPLAKTSRATG